MDGWVMAMPGRTWAVDWPMMGRAFMDEGRTFCWEPGAPAWVLAPAPVGLGWRILAPPMPGW